MHLAWKRPLDHIDFKRLKKVGPRPTILIMKALLTSLAVCGIAGMAQGHPHVFVDTGIEVIFNDQQQVSAVKVTWAYDEFYSLFIAEDFGVDKDGDGSITQEEAAKLAGFDANWIEGFEGDTYLTMGGEKLGLSGPLQPTATMFEGRIVTTHVRELDEPVTVSGNHLSVKPYDPTYYSAYYVTLPVKLSENSPCAFAQIEPDIDGELARMQSFLLTLDANADLEENDIPLMGEAFATEIRVTCPAS